MNQGTSASVGSQWKNYDPESNDTVSTLSDYPTSLSVHFRSEGTVDSFFLVVISFTIWKRYLYVKLSKIYAFIFLYYFKNIIQKTNPETDSARISAATRSMFCIT